MIQCQISVYGYSGLWYKGDPFLLSDTPSIGQAMRQSGCLGDIVTAPNQRVHVSKQTITVCTYTATVCIHHVTYTPDGELFSETLTPIVDPIHKTAAHWVASRMVLGWVATAQNQAAKVDRNGFLDVVTYLGKGELQ